MKKTTDVRNDFDEIARISERDGDPHSVYDGFLLRQVPPSADRLLEVGCGTGTFSRALADRGHSVVAIDLSPEMIRVARSRTSPEQDVDFRCLDFLSSADADQFDCVVTIGTLHHLPLDASIDRMKALVRAGGVLIIHDIRDDSGFSDWIRLPLALVARGISRLRSGRLSDSAALRRAFHDHGEGEQYLTMAQAVAIFHERLPGSRMTRHLQWRYTVVWQKPP